MGCEADLAWSVLQLMGGFAFQKALLSKISALLFVWNGE